MAELNLPMSQPSRLRTVAMSAPRSLMSWEDWLTLIPAILTFGAVAAAVQQADLVDRMPPIPVTTMGGLIVGLLMARSTRPAALSHLFGLVLGTFVVLLVVQDYAEGATIVDRLADVRLRLWEWWGVVRSGDVSNDNLPFVLSVHGLAMIASYIAAWSIFRWRNAWLAVVPAGIGILATIAAIDGRPSAAFVVFTVGALLLIARLNLQRRQVDWLRSSTPYPDFISLSAIQLATVLAVGLVVAAWLVPLGKQADAVESVVSRLTQPITSQSDTFTRLFHSVNANKSGNFHKFGTTMPIRGDVSLGNATLASVTPSVDGIRFIRGASYNEYTGNGWRSSDTDIIEVPANELPTQSVAGAQFASRQPIALTVSVIDEEPTLFSVGIPLGSNIDTIATLPEAFGGDIERLKADGGVSAGDQYVVGGTISLATPEELSVSGTAYPEWVLENLQLPDDLPPRVVTLAQEIVGDAQTPYEKAVLIEAYLRQFPFDFAVPSAPPGQDTADYFLFDLQRGYFDYFSTSMVVLLRAVDVPSRIAVGYALDPEEESVAGAVPIRKNDAYSWVEVFFNGYGWIDFNPSPDLPPGGVGFGGGGSLVSPPLDPTGLSDPDLSNLFDEVGELIGPDPSLDNTGVLGGDDGFSPPWTLIWVLTGIVALLAFAGGSLRLAWNWQFRGLSGTPRLWAKAQRLGGWAGVEPRGEETAREWSERLSAVTEFPDESRTLANAYQESRYGRPDLVRADPEETESAYVTVRGALIAKIFRRKPRKPKERDAEESGEE